MRRHRARIWLWALVAWGCTSAPEARPPAVLADGQYVMGTLFELTLHGEDAATLARARDDLFEQARALDAALSRYRPDSDASACEDGHFTQLYTPTSGSSPTGRERSCSKLSSTRMPSGPVTNSW